MIRLKELSYLRTGVLIDYLKTLLMLYWTLQLTSISYCADLFTESFQNNKKQFWSYIKRLQKDHSGVSSLIINGKTNSCAKEKLEY